MFSHTRARTHTHTHTSLVQSKCSVKEEVNHFYSRARGPGANAEPLSSLRVSFSWWWISLWSGQIQPGTVCPALVLSECSVSSENSKKFRLSTKAKKQHLRIVEAQLKVLIEKQRWFQVVWFVFMGFIFLKARSDEAPEECTALPSSKPRCGFHVTSSY